MLPPCCDCVGMPLFFATVTNSAERTAHYVTDFVLLFREGITHKPNTSTGLSPWIGPRVWWRYEADTSDCSGAVY